MNRTVTQPKLLRGGNTTTAIPSGYKRTEVGLIPEGWEIDDLDALVTVIDGDRGAHYPSANEFTDSGYCLFLNAGNVTKDGFKFAERAFITRKKDTLLSKGRLRRSDVVLTTRGTVGNLAYYDASVPYDHIRINSGMVILRNESSSLDTDFLYAVLRSPVVQLQMERLSFGSAQPQLTVKGISKFQIIVPPLPEQRAIARALSDVDGLIGTLDKLIAKKRALKQATMQQLLTGKTRLPGFTAEWEKKRIGDISACLSTANNPRADLSDDGDVEYIHYGDVHAHAKPVFDCRNGSLPRIDRTRIGNASRLEDGDLVMVDASEDLEGVGKSFEVQGVTGRTIFAGLHTILCRGNSAHWAMGFKAYLQFIPAFKSALLRVATGISVYAVSKKQLADVEIALPPVPEQRAIVAVLSDMDAAIAALERRRDKTKQIKHGMMQQLLTGRVRLVKPSEVESMA